MDQPEWADAANADRLVRLARELGGEKVVPYWKALRDSLTGWEFGLSMVLNGEEYEVSVAVQSRGQMVLFAPHVESAIRAHFQYVARNP